MVSISSTKIELIFTRIYIAGFLRARRISVFTRFSRAHFRLWWAPPIVRFLGLQGGGHGGLRNIDLEIVPGQSLEFLTILKLFLRVPGTTNL